MDFERKSVYVREAKGGKGRRTLFPKTIHEEVGRHLERVRRLFFSECERSLPDGFFGAGFTGFEIGLQSTNAEALSLVNHPTDLTRFLRGAEALQKKGMSLSLDLIAGLPGDDLEGFMRSVDFTANHGLGSDVQIFPLSVLPGTRLRSFNSGRFVGSMTRRQWIDTATASAMGSLNGTEIFRRPFS